MAKIILESNQIFQGRKSPYTEGMDVRGSNVTIIGAIVDCDGVALHSNYNCSGLHVKSCTFISHSKNAVHIIADTIKNVIKDITFEDCRFVGARMCVEIQNHKTDSVKIDGVTFSNCTFETLEDTDSRGYALSLTGYGNNVQVENCSINGRVKGVEIVGFSNVTLQNCEIHGGKESVISSNDRPMKNITLRLCNLFGKVQLENISDSSILWCTINAPYVEIKQSANVSLNGNNINSTGHYGIMFNQSKECLAINNTINQRGNNYSIVRCYNVGSVNNIIRDNILGMKRPKKGKWYDEEKGAKDNTFTNNKTTFINT